MADLRQRPFGDVVVELRRPLIRFGMDVLIGIRSSASEVVMAKITDAGELTYEPLERGVDNGPTLHLDDNEYEALYKALTSLPARFHGASHLDHLADVIKQRDELMDMVAKLNTQGHEVIMKALA